MIEQEKGKRESRKRKGKRERRKKNLKSSGVREKAKGSLSALFALAGKKGA